MTLSRTARFLILFLLLAAAAFVWVNFFLQDRAAETADLLAEGAQPVTAPVQAGVDQGVVATDTPDPTAPVVGEVPEDGSAEGTVIVEPEGAVIVESEGAAPVEPEGAAPVESDATAETEPVAAVEQPAATADDPTATPDGAVATPNIPTVIAPTAQTVVERELVVAEFPFLVTAPPATPTAAAAAEDSAIARPQTQRASINPFSPVLVQVPAAPATPVAAAVAPPTNDPQVQVVAVEVPGAPSLSQVPREPVVETVVAPTPRPLAPPSPLAQGLPRQLPGGTLPVAPDILQTTRVAPQRVDPVVEVEPVQPVEPDVIRPRQEDIAAAALIREPTDTIAADLETAGPAVNNSGSLPGLLGPAEIVADAAVETEPAVIVPAGTVPLAAGTNRLTRYLRDNGFAYTGSVLGPVSVGVFTSTLYGAPIVVALGQTLPDTDIVLTDLRGQQAEFSLDDTAQVLNLDLRR